MTDDLVKRLRVRAEFTGPYSALWDEAADRIEKLEAEIGVLFAANVRLNSRADLDSDHYVHRIEKLEAVTKDDAKWLAAYHQWCKMNGCAPSSSDLIAASKALEGKDGPVG